MNICNCTLALFRLPLSCDDVLAFRMQKCVWSLWPFEMLVSNLSIHFSLELVLSRKRYLLSMENPER